MNEFKPFCLILFFLLSVISVLPVFNYLDIFKKFTPKSFNNVSSVWCMSGFNNTKLCTFKNICYEPAHKTLLFFLTNESIIKGLSHYTELQNIQSSSIQHHNQFYVNLSVVTDYYLKENKTIEPKGLLFSRFKPNNIMHVVHDDLLPVYLTLEQVCAGNRFCIQSFRLVFHDKFPIGPFYNLYEFLSYKSPLLLNQLQSTFCFEEMLVGVITDGVFYQYGFQKSQGPLKTPHLSQTDVVRFSNYVKSKMDAKQFDVDIVVVSRMQNRRILNVDDVVEITKNLHQDIYKKTSSSVLILDLNTSGVFSFIQAVSQTDILIGMHGAEMIFSVFMKPNSTIIELFPYAIVPEVVSFVKPLSQLEGSYLNYISWRNMNENNSTPHPNAHPLFGGINHLDGETQKQIKSTKEVPPVKCCNNPNYLYHMYQDTWITNDLTESVYEYFRKKKSFENNTIIKKWFYPNPPWNVSCMCNEKKLTMKWFAPFNIEKINKIMYSLYIKDSVSGYWREISTSETSFEIRVEKNSKFQIWISVLYNNIKSSDLYMKCF